MSLEIIRNDITKVSADAIVNTANPHVGVGPGVDTAVYDAAGWDRLLAERAKIGEMSPGEAAWTPAFDLDAKYIIHTVGPSWQGGDDGEREILAECYKKALGIAKELDCESVAFPLMSAGSYGFPRDVALKVAISEISDFLFVNEMTVFLVVYDKESFEVSGKAFDDIKTYIEEASEVEEMRLETIRKRRRGRRRDLKRRPEGPDGSVRPLTIASVRDVEHAADYDAEAAADFDVEAAADFDVEAASEVILDVEDSFDALPETGVEIDDMLEHRDLTFQEQLFRIIDRKGLNDRDVYKKANIDRKHFSKIKSNVYYNPSKKTAVAFAIALGLNLDETRDLLLKAGLALTRSNPFDIIIEYCIENRIRDIHEINCILFEYDQPTLGA